MKLEFAYADPILGRFDLLLCSETYKTVDFKLYEEEPYDYNKEVETLRVLDEELKELINADIMWCRTNTGETLFSLSYMGKDYEKNGVDCNYSFFLKGRNYHLIDRKSGNTTFNASHLIVYKEESGTFFTSIDNQVCEEDSISKIVAGILIHYGKKIYMNDNFFSSYYDMNIPKVIRKGLRTKDIRYELIQTNKNIKLLIEE